MHRLIVLLLLLALQIAHHRAAGNGTVLLLLCSIFSFHSRLTQTHTHLYIRTTRQKWVCSRTFVHAVRVEFPTVRHEPDRRIVPGPITRTDQFRKCNKRKHPFIQLRIAASVCTSVWYVTEQFHCHNTHPPLMQRQSPFSEHRCPGHWYGGNVHSVPAFVFIPLMLVEPKAKHLPFDSSSSISTRACFKYSYVVFHYKHSRSLAR